MIFAKPIAFQEALDYLRGKRLLPTTLSSRQLSELPAELKRRSVFSARVFRADILEELGNSVEKIAGGLDAEGRLREAGMRTEDSAKLLSIPEAKARLKELLDKIGYQPHPDDEGTIKDLRSDRRLSLMVETNVLDAQGYGQFVSGNDEVALDVNPALELMRTRHSKVPRDWYARWEIARGASMSEGTTSAGSGRLVALKNHPIWSALGSPALFDDALGNPWSPFAFKSGMSLIEVDRDDAVALGLLTRETRVPPAPEHELNGGLRANTSRWRDSLAQALAEDPALTIEGGALGLAGNSRALAVNYPGQPREDGRFGEGRMMSADQGGGSGGSGVEAEITRGEAAMTRAIDTRSDVLDAMVKPGAGSIDFIWGNKGGGVAHIIDKRDREGRQRKSLAGQSGREVALKMPEVIARGTLGPPRADRSGVKRTIEWQGYKAVLSLSRDGNRRAWLLSGFAQT